MRHSDNLRMILQSPKMSAAKAQQIVSTTVKTPKTLRTEENFRFYCTNTIKTFHRQNFMIQQRSITVKYTMKH